MTGHLGGPGPSWPGSGQSQPSSAAPQEVPRDGKPGAMAAGLPLASFPRRAVGFVIDLFLFSIVITTLLALTGVEDPERSATTQVGALLFQVAYNWLWNSIGWSPGKRAVGLRIVRDDGGPPGPTYGFGRSVGALVSNLTFLLGYLWALWDRRSQTWHDRLAGTYVVRVSGRELEEGAR